MSEYHPIDVANIDMKDVKISNMTRHDPDGVCALEVEVDDAYYVIDISTADRPATNDWVKNLNQEIVFLCSFLDLDLCEEGEENEDERRLNQLKLANAVFQQPDNCLFLKEAIRFYTLCSAKEVEDEEKTGEMGERTYFRCPLVNVVDKPELLIAIRPTVDEGKPAWDVIANWPEMKCMWLATKPTLKDAVDEVDRLVEETYEDDEDELERIAEDDRRAVENDEDEFGDEDDEEDENP